MTKILSQHKYKKIDVIVITSLVASIIFSSFFIFFSPDQNIRDYNALLMSAISIGVALVICLGQVFRYKKRIRKFRSLSKMSNNKQLHYYYDNNKMHFSICLFLALWLAAQLMWLLYYQEISSPDFSDLIWFTGYASFGYFLYSLYYHFFRKQFDILVLILVAIIIALVLIIIIYPIVGALRGYADLVYPILDAILIFPAVLILLAVRRIKKDPTVISERQETGRTKIEDETKPFYGISTVSSIWIMLLSISMILSAIGDIGLAYSTALAQNIALRYVWIWNIIFNADHLCIAAALIGYRHFFSFNRIDALQH